MELSTRLERTALGLRYSDAHGQPSFETGDRAARAIWTSASAAARGPARRSGSPAGYSIGSPATKRAISSVYAGQAPLVADRPEPAPGEAALVDEARASAPASPAEST